MWLPTWSPPVASLAEAAAGGVVRATRRAALTLGRAYKMSPRGESVGPLDRDPYSLLATGAYEAAAAAAAAPARDPPPIPLRRGVCGRVAAPLGHPRSGFWLSHSVFQESPGCTVLWLTPFSLASAGRVVEAGEALARRARRYAIADAGLNRRQCRPPIVALASAGALLTHFGGPPVLLLTPPPPPSLTGGLPSRLCLCLAW